MTISKAVQAEHFQPIHTSGRQQESMTIPKAVQAEHFQPIHTSGRQQEIMTITRAAHTVLEVPDDGRENSPKHVQR
jgi:hypothetical protein